VPIFETLLKTDDIGVCHDLVQFDFCKQFSPGLCILELILCHHFDRLSAVPALDRVDSCETAFAQKFFST
jgi:hypothetical protein